jgi:uncharacterized membrane protein YqgA involved in biofilm formation
MLGTIINFFAIILGSLIGVFFGSRLPEKLKDTVMAGMGLFIVAIGVQMFLETENGLIVLGALVIGAILGEWWRLEDLLMSLGAWLENKFTRGSEGSSSRFVRGFLATTVLFCTGPMAVLGSISDGLQGDSLTLIIKSVMDGIASIAFASTMGIGVAFSALPVLVYQGTISLLAGQLDAIVTASMMNEMTATGGVLLMGIGVSGILEIKKIRVGNFLPALLIAPLIVYVISLFQV